MICSILKQKELINDIRSAKMVTIIYKKNGETTDYVGERKVLL